MIDEDSFIHSVVSSLNHELAIDDSSDSSTSATSTADEAEQFLFNQDDTREGRLDERHLLRCLHQRRKLLEHSLKVFCFLFLSA